MAYKCSRLLCAVAGLVCLGITQTFAQSLDWGGKPEGRAWTKIVADAIVANDDELIAATPSDMSVYCPGYATKNTEAKREFWAMLFSALARYESNYDPATSFTESFKDSAGKFVVSRGLLQISKESANGYGCGINDENVLHDPAVNLACAVKIGQRWVSKDGRISKLTTSGKWRGMARYWSPFRSDTKRAVLQRALRGAPGCGE